MSADLLIGLMIFISVLLVHIVVWRIIKPKSEINAVVIMFAIIPGIIIISTYIFLGQIINWRLIDFMVSTLLYFALAGAYIQTYPGFNCEIPSLKMLRIIEKYGLNGASIEEISKHFDLKELLESRAELLEKDGFVIKSQEGTTKLSAKGKILANFFLILRKIYGLKAGQG